MNAKDPISLIANIFFFSFFGCGQQMNTATINGKIDNCPQCNVLIKEASGNGFVMVDSTRTNKKGEFMFEVELSTPKFYVVHILPEREPLMLLIEPKEEIILSIGEKNRGRNYFVTGSRGSTIVKDLNAKMNYVLETIDTLSLNFRRNVNSEKFDSIKTSIDSQYNKLIADYRTYSTRFVKENRYSLAAILALNQQYNQSEKVFNKRDDFALYQLVDSSLTAILPNNNLVKNFHENVKKMTSQLALFDRQQEMQSIGEKITLVDLPLINGTNENLSRLMGRFTLIDFWASWCNDCRANNLKLKVIHSKYSPKGFQIVQFAIDDAPEKVLKIIESDSLIWLHASDFKQWESPYLNEFHINSIPSNYLIDRNGSIVDRNLSPKRLEEVLGALLP
jgi:thiol-disulfide isomerase/thioredoxin